MEIGVHGVIMQIARKTVVVADLTELDYAMTHYLSLEEPIARAIAHCPKSGTQVAIQLNKQNLAHAPA